jgi:uncharacterized membrane protein
MQLSLALTYIILPTKQSQYIFWPMVILHLVTALFLAISYWVSLTSTVRTIGLTIILPVYIIVLAYYLANCLYEIYNDKLNFGNTNQMRTFFLILLELAVIVANVLSSILSMSLRAIFSESFFARRMDSRVTRILQ